MVEPVAGGDDVCPDSAQDVQAQPPIDAADKVMEDTGLNHGDGCMQRDVEMTSADTAPIEADTAGQPNPVPSN
eukprot:CAMPEP_0202914514 /NCGR_PEP_ID=MMETSP1392-20130828/63260_1 /ASSEMBLY_ACC=CAM_ASM_000868 /TAXON_ID=225041 /ORGANISM="Chlamydomonas chlamydogama, Strain SAG 11-48b" /LENGTH=72 /DNA_ID=CAMNT_0049606179 /DNA_START=97 /DNA_END=312 /DNA_ORIENTATION=+